MFPMNTRILIVDDMKTMRIVIKRSLLALGFSDVTEADDGDNAIVAVESAITEQRPFKLIISDWTMARVSGLDFLKQMRAHKIMSKVPFLMITAESDAAQVKEAVAAGVSNYITKPFTQETVKAKLEAIWKKQA